jgi:hypothetical protein
VQQRRVAVLNPPRPNGARDTRLIEAQHSGVPFWVRLMLLVNSVVMSLLVHLNRSPLSTCTNARVAPGLERDSLAIKSVKPKVDHHG